MKYRIEAGIETKTSLSTIKVFSNAEDLRQYINGLDSSVWYVVEYADTRQEILSHNFGAEGTKYQPLMKCPKALQGL